MSLNELQSWLLEEGVREELAAVTRLTVRSEIDNLVPEPDLPDRRTVDWPRLVLAGSVLARTDERIGQEAALRIATAALSLSEERPVRDAGAVLLGKLSNFRAAGLAVDRDLVEVDLDARLGVALRLEAQRRELDRSILVESKGAWIQVNDFQQRFWNSAGEASWLSASAPTASGKTFLVLQWLVDQMITREFRVAVYLAPTRALVAEIESNLSELVDARIEVSSLPLGGKYEAARAGGLPLILVFTQERLHLLANMIGKALSIDLLVVDEAHKIGDNQRGVILQDAVERAVRSNPALKAVFISPATQNPGELLADAPADARLAPIDSDNPTVLQNLILARQAPGNSKNWNLSLRQGGSSSHLGTLRLASTPGRKGHRKQLAFIAAAAGERGGTLVYTNGAGESEVVADLISQVAGNKGEVDQELRELAELARKGVHPDFRLAPLVERGVAFHFGNMPSLIRSEIERLFRAGKIRFLVCTSTLIEGVNLSCRTIVLRGPQKGKGHPMEPHDFWNLAGRAGRWGDEFQGNIICIDPEDAAAWPTGVPERARYPIKRESDAVLERGEGLVNYLVERAGADLSDVESMAAFENVGAYLLAAYMRTGSIAETNLSRRHNPAFLAQLDVELKRIAAGIEIDLPLVERHPGVSAVGLQRLLEAFRAYRGEVENLLPADVASFDSHDRFLTIMSRINKHLYPAFGPEKMTSLYALVVVRWLEGLSLAEMIRRSIAWHEDVGRSFTLPVLIRDTMDHVEQIARFRAPKYLSAYMDILNLHLRQMGREDLIESGVDIGTQLEFGVSTRTLLSLMEIGLSRMSAVALFERIARDDLTSEDCVEWIRERHGQLEAMGIPAVIAREVYRLVPPDDRMAT